MQGEQALKWNPRPLYWPLLYDVFRSLARHGVQRFLRFWLLVTPVRSLALALRVCRGQSDNGSRAMSSGKKFNFVI